MGESTGRADPESDPQTQQLDPSQWRSDFPILAKKIHEQPLVYLDNAATTQKPRQVLAAIFRAASNRSVLSSLST